MPHGPLLQICIGTGPIALDPLVTGDGRNVGWRRRGPGASLRPIGRPRTVCDRPARWVSPGLRVELDAGDAVLPVGCLAGEDAMVCNTHQLGASPVQAIGNWSGPNGVQFIPEQPILRSGRGTGRATTSSSGRSEMGSAGTRTRCRSLSCPMTSAICPVDAGPDQVLDIQSTTQLERKQFGKQQPLDGVPGKRRVADATDPLTQVTGLEQAPTSGLTGSNGPCAERHDTLRVRQGPVHSRLLPNGDGVNDLFEMWHIHLPDNTFRCSIDRGARCSRNRLCQWLGWQEVGPVATCLTTPISMC